MSAAKSNTAGADQQACMPMLFSYYLGYSNEHKDNGLDTALRMEKTSWKQQST
jgi:hypothetical protein